MRGREVSMVMGAVVAKWDRCLWAARREEMVGPRESRREEEEERAFGGEAGGGFGGDLVGDGVGLREISWRGKEGARRVWEESSREMFSVCGVPLLSSVGVSVLSWLTSEDVGCGTGASVLNASPSFSFESVSFLTILSTTFSYLTGFSELFPIRFSLVFSETLLFSVGRSAGHGWTR